MGNEVERRQDFTLNVVISEAQEIGGDAFGQS
jgi:hypothetical protein